MQRNSDDAIGGSAAWQPKTIVVGYNGTDSAEWALHRAIQLARVFAARVVVADVAVPTELQETPGAFGYLPYYGDLAEGGVWTDEALWQQHRSRIEELLGQDGIEYEFAGMIGEPVDEIIDVAEKRHADLIVVGTREPGFLARVLGASVSQDLARRAHCDVLVVHAREG
jgi:nucleotide-binding universal stress UspA family protein